jgi:hypothetical protein
MTRRYKYTLILILLSTLGYGQINCNCSESSEKLVDCSPIKFESGAYLFWSYNCDSSWMTFVDKKKKKSILFSLGDGLEGYTGRLGYYYVTSYKGIFLIRNGVISGCCDPPEYITFDNTTGKEIQNYGRVLYYSEIKSDPLIIKFQESSYDNWHTDKRPNLNIQLVNPVTGKKTTLRTNQPKLNKWIENSDYMFPENLIDKVQVNSKIIKITYRYKAGDNWKIESRIIVRKKYGV